MSQYPSPYSPPPQGYPNYYGFDPHAVALAPARRASTLMIIVAVLGLLLGVCAGIASRVPVGQYPPETQEQMRQMESLYKMPLPTFFMLAALIFGIPSLLLLIFGIWVRGGTKASLVTSIVYTAILTLLMAANLAVALKAGAAAKPGDLFIPVVVLAALVVMLVWLAQALKAIASLRGSQAGFQNQYWQQQQAYWQWQQGQQMPPMAPPPPPPGQPPVGGYTPPPPPPPPSHPGPPDQPPPQA